jgi:hypothetical protein
VFAVHGVGVGLGSWLVGDKQWGSAIDMFKGLQQLQGQSMAWWHVAA